jgi:hypothetical protein
MFSIIEESKEPTTSCCCQHLHMSKESLYRVVNPNARSFLPLPARSRVDRWARQLIMAAQTPMGPQHRLEFTPHYVP